MVADAGMGARRVVRVLADPDVAHTAVLHAQELPGGFFPRLGHRFLRVYHRSFIDSPHAVAFVARREDSPAVRRRLRLPEPAAVRSKSPPRRPHSTRRRA